MGAMDEHQYEMKLEGALNLGCMKTGMEIEPEIQAAVRILLQGLGEDVDREGIKKTPLRVAKALRDGTKGYKQNVQEIVEGALFPEAGLENNRVGQAGGVGGLVIVRDLNLYSYCESCLLPFQVKCHVGYVPSGQQVVGLSKLSRVADVFAKRLQNPQRLADEICSSLQLSIRPTGVAVVLECLHIDFQSGGWEKLMVSSGSGVFQDQKDVNNNNIWTEFFSLLKIQSSVSGNTQKRINSISHWCPSEASETSTIPPSGMISAVTSMLRALGEDPLRKELVGTPTRFLSWLMNFQICSIEKKLNAFAGNMLEPNMKANGEVKCNMKAYSELNLPLWSMCEHHLLPFYGVVHIGYFSAEEINPTRKSILQEVVHFYGSKLQVQERLTKEIAETVAPFLGGDVIVVAEASHTCMLSRGVEKFGSSTATVAVLGRFSTDSEARALFLGSLP
ncbi:GTP cyclohydrolase 1 [Spinacia oleracea]|uniref:GTP cyclohydrolase 1 n=1 Tax=Spinacia oleracea TaxID=3562 RepID=A0A9R0JC07_SPIOL|nr:GTP cyclohydrolase 1-like [Spinacia oleracea]